MGIFSDKCTAIVSLATGRHLTGDELAAAKEALRSEAGIFHSKSSVLAKRGWGICGHDVKKKARFCSKCGAGAPKGWIKCPSCGKWVGNEMTHCWNCDHPLHPETRTDLEGGVWNRTPETFAERFEVGEVENMLKNGIQVQEGSAAILLDAGRENRVLGPGRHNPDSALRSINWFGNPPPRSAVLVDAGEFVVPVRMSEGLVTADACKVSFYAELTIRFLTGRADDFMANLMKDQRSVSYETIGEKISATLVYGVKNLCNTSTLEDLVKDPARRDQFEDAIHKAAAETLKAWAFEVVRVGAVDFASPEYEKMCADNAAFEAKRREVEFLSKTRELLAREAGVETGKTMDKARSEQELADYLEGLAQEKKIGDVERDAELKLVIMAKQHQISHQEAEYEIVRKTTVRAAEMEAELKDTDHDIALREKLRAYTVEAMLKDALGQEELAKIQAREEAIRDTIAKGKIDLDIYRKNAENDVELKRLKGLREIDRDIDESKIKAKDAEAARLKNLGIEALIATADDPEKIRALVELARISAQKGMAADQILATAADKSTVAAQAAGTALSAGRADLERLVAEIKEISGKNSEKDERLLKELAGVMGRAAERKDAAGTTQIIR